MSLRHEDARCYLGKGSLMPPMCGVLSHRGEQGLSLFTRFLPETIRVNALAVGNQDSLQRGLRPLAGEEVLNVVSPVGNQDSLQRGLRRGGLR